MARPVTKYKENLPKKLIDHMSKGYSFESFGAVADCTRACLYKWVEKYPEFKEAKDMGTMKSQYVWEKIGLEMALTKHDGNPTAWIFNMKNRFGWRDKVEHSGDQEKPIGMKLFCPKEKPDGEE